MRRWFAHVDVWCRRLYGAVQCGCFPHHQVVHNFLPHSAVSHAVTADTQRVTGFSVTGATASDVFPPSGLRMYLLVASAETLNDVVEAEVNTPTKPPPAHALPITHALDGSLCMRRHGSNMPFVFGAQRAECAIREGMYYGQMVVSYAIPVMNVCCV